MACIALGESASASRRGQGHIEHDWRVCWPMKDRYAGEPALWQEGAALAYGRPVQAAWLFSAAQNGGRYLRPHRPQGPRHSISSGCRGRSAVGSSTASVYRQLGKPLERNGLSLARTMRTVRTVSPRHLLAHW